MNSLNNLQSYYQWHAPIYDLSRWTFLGGRKALIDKICSSKASMVSNSAFLEIGSGTAWLLKKGAEEQPNRTWIGIDLSTEMMQIAKQRTRYLSNVELISGSVLDYLPKQPFELIYASYAISMMKPILEKLIPQLQKLLSEIGDLWILDFYQSPSSLFRKWMGVNHVCFFDDLQTTFSPYFTIELVEKVPMYFGLWTYGVFKLKAIPKPK
jgi:S-adenosylmethionine-diacylgycerolhomoserine-N-methlytransferase